MKHIFLVMGLSSYLWGCSVDTGQKTATNPADSANSSGTSENAEGIKEGTATSNNEGTVAVPVDTGAPSGDSGSSKATASADGSSGSTASSGSKTQNNASNTQSNTSASAPAQVTGAYLVGAILPAVDGEPKKIGLIAKKVDQRLSDDPEHYLTKWSMTLASADIPATLEKSDDPAFDEILEFTGTDEEFAKMQSQIKIEIKVSDPSSEFGLNEVVSTTLADLFLSQAQ